MVLKDIVLAIRFTHIIPESYDEYTFYDRDIPGCVGIPEGWRLKVGSKESVHEATEASLNLMGCM